jgi:branched-chain amino acid transport system substrate-binding protein
MRHRPLSASVSLVLLGLAGFLASAVLLCGCSSEESGPPPLRIGANLPLSGDRSSYGRDALNGILAAVEAINRAGGVEGRRVDLIVADNESRPERSAEVVAELDAKGVVAVLGPLASGSAIAAAAEVQRRRLPMVLPSATLDEISGMGEYVCRICFTNRFQARVIAYFADEFLKARTFAVVSEAGSAYSEELSRLFAESARARGGRVVLETRYETGQESFEALVESLARESLDAVFLPGYHAEVRAILEAMRARGLRMPVLGGDGWDVPYQVDCPPERGAGNYFVAHFSAGEPGDAVGEFVSAYTTKYGYPPHSLAALGYDAVWLIADAAGRASGGGREELKNAIHSTRGFPGLTGTLSLDASRNPVKSAVIVKTAPGGLEFIQRVDPRVVGEGLPAEKVRQPLSS